VSSVVCAHCGGSCETYFHAAEFIQSALSSSTVWLSSLVEAWAAAWSGSYLICLPPKGVGIGIGLFVPPAQSPRCCLDLSSLYCLVSGGPEHRR
jgi:hypothetical protein